jgi:hypothetical protein
MSGVAEIAKSEQILAGLIRKQHGKLLRLNSLGVTVKRLKNQRKQAIDTSISITVDHKYIIQTFQGFSTTSFLKQSRDSIQLSRKAGITILNRSIHERKPTSQKDRQKRRETLRLQTPTVQLKGNPEHAGGE